MTKPSLDFFSLFIVLNESLRNNIINKYNKKLVHKYKNILYNNVIRLYL